MLPVADSSTPAPGRFSYARIAEKREIPDLIELQVRSFAWFVEKGLRELFDEISPIRDFTGKVMELQFLDYEFGDPKYSELECRTRDLTFSRPLYVQVELTIKETGEIQRQRVYMGDYPWMTDLGTFIINGAERVVVSQLVRSPGVYYGKVEDPVSGRDLYTAKVIPNRGAWLEFETAARGDLLSVKVDRKRKIAATTLLRAVGYERDEEIAAPLRRRRRQPGARVHRLDARQGPDEHPGGSAHRGLQEAAPGRPADRRQRPPARREPLLQLPALRPGARRPLQVQQEARRRSPPGWASSCRARTCENPQLGRTITKEDIAAIVGQLIVLNNGHGQPDDIDHLGNRRIRANGELIQNAFRIGLLRMERVVRERMTIQEIEKATPNALINIRPVVAAMKEFFGGSQLSQFMDQTNPLAELTSKRRLSALGPGGLSRERAGFDVRDVHHSHYGRICPIETPEGPNIGLIGSLATYGRINDYGFIETPYRKVKRTVAWDDADLLSYTAGGDLVAKGGVVVLARGEPLTAAAATELKKQKAQAFPIRPVVTDEIVYLAADEEEEHYVAQANARLDEPGPLPHRARSVSLPGPVPGGRARPHRVHGRQPEAGRLRGDRAHPVPRARRREPRPDGLEHAAPGRAAPRARGADRRHRHGAPSGARLRPGRHRPRGRRRHLGDRRPGPRRGGLRASCGPTRSRSSSASNQGTCINQRPIVAVGQRVAARRCDRRLVVDRRRRAGPRPQHPRRLHELGGRQLRGRDRHQRPARPRGPLHQHPHREARDRVARHEARAGGDHPGHPERRRGVAQGPRRGRDRLHRGRGPARATSSSARSRRRARPS